MAEMNLDLGSGEIKFPGKLLSSTCNLELCTLNSETGSPVPL